MTNNESSPLENLAKYSLPILFLWTILVIAITLIHIFRPQVVIDTNTIILLGIAVLPWLFPYVKKIVVGNKGVELDVSQKVSNTVSSLKSFLVSFRPQEPAQRMQITVPSTSKVGPEEITDLRRITNSDPRMAFIGFRVEIEKRLRDLAEKSEMDPKLSLNKILLSLQKTDILPKQIYSGLSDLIRLGDNVAQGLDVDRDAVDQLMEIGSEILEFLEKRVPKSPPS